MTSNLNRAKSRVNKNKEMRDPLHFRNNFFFPTDMLPCVNVILIRHAETDNNFIQMVDMHIKPAERKPDVSITERGFRQSEATGRFISAIPHLKRVIVSPMLRTLQTASPLVKLVAQNVPVDVWLDLYEEGGIFRGTRFEHQEALMAKAKRGSDVDVCGYPLEHGLNPSDFHKILGCESVKVVSDAGSGVSNNLGWWRGGFETQEEVDKRADGLVQKIWALAREVASKEPSLDTADISKVADSSISTDDPSDHSTIVFVTHGLIMDSISRRLMQMSAPRERVPIFTNNCGINIFHLYPGHAAYPDQLGVPTKGSVAVACLNNTAHIDSQDQSGHTVGALFRCSKDYLGGMRS